MATVKGTWKLNDVLTDYAHINENVNYTCNAYSRLFGVEVLANCFGIASGAFAGQEVNGLYCLVESTAPDLSAYGFVCPRDVRVYQADGWNTGAFEIKDKCIYFGDAQQEVSDEFYNWLTQNAVEQKEISGKWRFREVLTSPAGAFKETISFWNGGESFNAMYAKSIADTTGFGLEFSKITASGGEILLAYADGAYGDLFAVSGWADDAYRTIDFGTESQAVSAEFYDWLTGNAVQSNGSLLYRGETIAELFPGQTVTLKCGGMRMEDDVVVRV